MSLMSLVLGQVPLESSSGDPHLEVGRETLTLLAQSGPDSVQKDEREDSEVEETETITTSTHPLTARTSEDKDSLDGEESEGERRFRNIEEWNFSSVQTVDEKSVDEVCFLTSLGRAVSQLFPTIGSSERSDRQDLQKRQDPSRCW